MHSPFEGQIINQGIGSMSIFTNSLEGHLCICLYLTITVSVLICPEMANYHSCMYVINEMIYDVLLDM